MKQNHLSTLIIAKHFLVRRSLCFRFTATVPGWELAIRFFPLDTLHLRSKVIQAELYPNRIFLFFFSPLI